MSLGGQRPVRTPEWVSIHEAALLMGVSSATLRRWSDAGEIRTFTTPGGHRRFSRTAIAGLLPDIGPEPASRDQVLEDVRRRTERIVEHAARCVAGDLHRRTHVGPQDVALVEVQVQRVLAALLGSLDSSRASARASTLPVARSAAGACGELAGTRGLGLCETVEAWLRLRRIVLREFSWAARRHDLDLSTTTRWLDAASQDLDAMLLDVMREHQRARTPLRT